MISLINELKLIANVTRMTYFLLFWISNESDNALDKICILNVNQKITQTLGRDNVQNNQLDFNIVK